MRTVDRTLACRACGDRRLVDLGACPQVGDGEPDRLHRCMGCGLGQRNPIPGQDAIAAMYADAPLEAMDYDYEQNAAWALARKKLLERFGKDALISVLDVGCHTGAFLGGLPEGWSRHGIESASEPSRFASERNAVRIVGSRVEDVGYDLAGRFDAVTMFDVVEHLPDPQTGIRAALRLLKPGGILLLSTADLDAWTWRWLGAGHWYLQTPQHLAVLSRKFLRIVARDCQARLVEVDEIPHRHSSMSVRLGEALQAIYWGMRLRRGAWRVTHRLLQSLPGLRSLRHRTSVPWTMALKDHFLCSFEPSGAGCR